MRDMLEHYLIKAVLLLLTFVIYILIALKNPKSFDENLIGKTGKVKKTLSPEGMVFINGELWRAVSLDGETIEKGNKVTVEKTEGLTVYVKPNV